MEEMNTAGITGVVAAAPEKRNNLYGKPGIFTLWLDAERDSGVIDRVLVLFQEEKIEGESFNALPGDYFVPGDLAALIKPGSTVEVTGKVQTYKNTQTGKTQLFVWALYLAAVPENSQRINTCYITGEVARQPIYRATPRGIRITEIALRVPSAFSEGFYSFIPCITWDRLADDVAGLQEGQAVHIEGRIQHRTYRKTTEEGTRELSTWEVSVNKMNIAE